MAGDWRDRLPVLVGLGELRGTAAAPAGEVPSFMARAVRLAALDAAGGDAALAERVLGAAGALGVAPSATWPDRNPGVAVAAELGIAPHTLRSSMVGGNGSQLIVNELCRRIQAGELDVALMCGGEALHSQVTPFSSFGEAASSDERGSSEVLEGDRPGNSEAEIEVGLMLPILGYALIEQAIARREGRTVSQQTQRAAQLWSRFSQVAARQPNAWVRTPMTAEEIATPAAANRQVTYPYTKLMVANFRVDQAGALVVMSAGAAERFGIPRSRWTYVHAGAQANDEWFMSERDDLARSPAIRAIASALYRHAEIGPTELGPVDLYSCFPSAVQLAASELGLPIDDPRRPLTETGGLTFFGGPGNNFGTHGVIAVARRLRAEPPGTLGLSSSLGWYATKHAYGLYGNAAPAREYETLSPTPQPARRAVASAAQAAEAGDAVVEVATALYDRDGAPQSGIVFALLADGRRAIGRATAPATLAALTRDGAIGRRVTLAADRTVSLS